MKIFSPPKSNAAAETSAGKKNGKLTKKQAAAAAAAPVKSEVSESEIREKLASHVETSNTAKSRLVTKNSKAFGASFMNEDALPIPKDIEDLAESKTAKKGNSLKDSHLLLSDVKLNDPNDSNTQEKLKMVLKSGAFGFNPREKETLEKILSGN
ncbi:MAG: hypothetical protein Q7U04_15735 [Bacteriovorax sp.]|nr:hypothetical protein [Bacteriovorax sp.]